MSMSNPKPGGLWANIHAKRKRIKAGSGERMRKPGSKGAPTAQDFKDAQENFMDGKNPQDKGDMARHGLKGKSISQLKKIRSSDKASKRQKQLAHWYINMHDEKVIMTFSNWSELNEAQRDCDL
ncbi:MAG: hypothetical protein EBY41_00650 [Proteobacteria bacterium]|nr:hypothetical protein [Pseudomonadota bacterium]